MSKKLTALQQRAQIITILSKYLKAQNIDNAQLFKDITEIDKIENKSLIFKTLFQEINNSNVQLYLDVCSIVALETIDEETFEKEAIVLLQDNKISDDKKFMVMSLMKQKGLNFNYRDITNYVENAQELAHSGVKNFLNNALIEAEVQIDLLDFFINIPKEEKLCFLDNLKEEFDGDNLANAFSILIQVKSLQEDEFEIILDELLNIDSPYAIKGLNYALNTKETKKSSKIKQKIKELKFKYPKFKDNDLIKNSKVFNCYIGFVDGKSNFPLILSRKKEEGILDALLITVNTEVGITSCVGFSNMQLENFLSVIKRLFSDSAPIKITPVALKSLFEHYYKKSNENNIELPYELIVWKNLLNDIRIINYDLSEFINSKLDIISLTENKVKKFASSMIVETWFFEQGQNKNIDKIIEEIENKHIVDLDEINILTSKIIDKEIMNDNCFIKEFQSKLLIQAYVAKLAKYKVTSSYAYSLCFKSPYMKIFLNSIIDKSIYYYLNSRLNENKENNRFKKKAQTSFNKEEIEILLAQLEEKWS